jgi:hypothetical protein
VTLGYRRLHIVIPSSDLVLAIEANGERSDFENAWGKLTDAISSTLHKFGDCCVGAQSAAETLSARIDRNVRQSAKAAKRDETTMLRPSGCNDGRSALPTVALSSLRPIRFLS